jgi:hypothetical protein
MENIESKVEKLSLGKDDVLVIFIPHSHVPKFGKFYRKHLPMSLPYNNNVIVLPDMYKLAIIEKKYKSLWDMDDL